jgi:hypothetical protein
MSLTGRATVTLTIEVHQLGSWGAKCALEQVRSQAVEAAVGRLQHLGAHHNFKIVGKPTIGTVTLEEK